MTADNFSRNVMISLGLHMAVAMLIFFRAAMMPNEPIQIHDAIRVDVVGLPQKLQELPAEKVEKPAPAPAPKELPKKVETPPVKAKPVVKETPKKKEIDFSKSQKAALEKMKQREAIENLEKAMSQEKAAKAKAKAAVVAGNKVSAGNSLSGMDSLDKDKYFTEIKDKVHNSWSIPQWLADANLKAQVRVTIDDRGFVLRKVFVKSSGNDIFDAKVSEAIDNSSPFPPPPSNIRGNLANSGVVFSFPLE